MNLPPPEDYKIGPDEIFPWGERAAIERLRLENIGMRAQMFNAEHRAERWKLFSWMLLVFCALLLYCVAELRGCVSHKQEPETPVFPY